MKPISGLNRDVNPVDQPPNTMRYAANGTISETTGIAQNIRDEFQWEEWGVQKHIVGWHLGEHLIYVFMYDEISSYGNIYRFNPDIAGSKELIILDTLNFLEFKEEAGFEAGFEGQRFLQIVYQQDFKEHEVFAWAGQTRPKILDVGKVLEDAGYDPALQCADPSMG